MVCGTGTGNFPQPGDPDLNGATLSARVVLTGVEVSWSYPLLNAHALAYVNLFRNTANELSTAQLRATCSGSLFLDNEYPDTEITYWYWIQMVSVNGTEGGIIGPVSVTLNATTERLIELLQNSIAESHLAGALRERVNSVVGYESGLQAEIEERIYSDGVLQALLSSMQDDLDAVDTLVASEVIERVEGDSALVASINLIQAQANDNSAAIINEAIVRANAHESLAATVTTLEAQVDDNAASIVEEQIARTDAHESLAATVTALTATVGDNTAAISQEASARATEFEAVSSALSSLQASVDGNAAAIVVEQNARATADGAFTNQLTTLSATVNGHTSSIATTQSVVAGISAEYLVRLDVNGYVSGFGVYNNGTSADFLIHADKFAIGKPGATKDYPFIIGTVNGATKIALNAATFIPDLTVTTGKIANLSVETLKIADQAVTVPAQKTQSSGITLSSFSSWYEVINLSVNFGSYAPAGALVMATVNLNYSSGDGETIYEIMIDYAGGDYGTVQVSAPSGYALSLVTMAGITGVSTGSNMFRVYVRRVFGGTIHVTGSRSIVVLGVRK